MLKSFILGALQLVPSKACAIVSESDVERAAAQAGGRRRSAVVAKGGHGCQRSCQLLANGLAGRLGIVTQSQNEREWGNEFYYYKCSPLR